MNRHYTVAQYMDLVNYAKEKIPGVTSVSYTHLDVYKRQTYDTPPLAYVRSYGCQQNVNDGEKIRGVLMDLSLIHIYPHWRERRQPGKAYPGPLRCPCAGSHGGKCHVPCAPAGKA